MSDLVAELTAFMERYAQANNSHAITRVAPMIDEGATYWFSDGSHRGHGEITAAIERTFSRIHDEVYEIKALERVVVNDVRFGDPRHGDGRTNGHVCLNERRATLTEIVYGRTSEVASRGGLMHTRLRR